jgi:dCTP deaminase
MILTGLEILKRINKGDIVIDPFDKKNINPNSYNLKLDSKLKKYLSNDDFLDLKKENKMHDLKIPDNGLVLYPGTLYLGKTIEYTETYNLVPMVEGRSSLGRLGIFVHVTAGFGDIGFCGQWTLEISVIKPIKIYSKIECCQIYYNTIYGDIINYNGKYQKAKEIQGSKIYQEF